MGGSGTSQSDVAFDGVVEEHRVLRHHAHVGAQTLLPVVAQGDAVDQYVARRGVVEAGDQFAECRFAAARRTHQSHRLAAADFERHAVDHLAAAVVGEVDVAEFDLLLQPPERLRLGLVLDFAAGVDDREDAFAGGDALVDVGELVDERAHRARDLREHGDEGDESARIERPADHQRPAEDEHDAHGRDAQEFAHGRCQLLAPRHRKGDAREVGVDGVELALDIVGGVVALDDLDARERFVERRDQLAHALLVRQGRVPQPLDDAADEQGHDREVEKRKKRQLPRDSDHHYKVEDDQKRFAERHLQRVGDAELHHVDVRGDFRNDVALALVAEVARVHVDHAREHVVADALQGFGAQLLDGPRPQIAEKVAQKTRPHGDGGQQDQHVLDAELGEKAAVAVVEQRFQIGRVEFHGRQLLNDFERIVGLEHRVQDRDDQQKRARVEKRVEKRVEEVGNGITADGLGES